MPSLSYEPAAVLDRVFRARKSVRYFRPDPVPKATLQDILAVAGTAPSNFNSQPWRVHVLTGQPKRALGEAMLAAHVTTAVPSFTPFPEPMPVQTAARVGEFGRRLYSAMGVDRADATGRARVSGRNFVFFDAPVGLIFTIDGALTNHSWLDCGLFVQSVMLAAQVRGLSTCPQVSFVRFQTLIAERLELRPGELVTCGMSLGYAEEGHPVNELNVPRAPLDDFTRWLGFEE